MVYTRKSTKKNGRRQARRGGGWSQGPALSAQAYYVPEYKNYTECYDFSRPGGIQSNPNPALAQTQMAGGRRRRTGRKTKRGGACGVMRGAGCGLVRGGSRRKATRGGAGCGLVRGGSRRKATRGGAGCGLMRSSRRNRRQRGGRFGIDPSQSIGGDGPNVAPLYASVPCEAHRPMPLNPTSPNQLSMAQTPDYSVSGLRPAFLQAGGAHPLAYTAPRAEYSFTPNIAQGAVLNAGQIPYNVVVPISTGGASCGTAMAQINKMV